jgi:uncharacterized protein YjbI with pentapeptide repeats
LPVPFALLASQINCGLLCPQLATGPCEAETGYFRNIEMMDAFKKVIVAAFVAFVPAPSVAWDAGDLDRFLGSMSCGLCDLAGANLVKMDLRAAKLNGADLSEARLLYSSLIGATLSGANLGKADLRGASLFYADLAGANLVGADLSGANLVGANLSGANLADADLGGADLYGANLSGADLKAANLASAYLYGATLAGAVNAGANLDAATQCNTILPDGEVSDSGCGDN